MSLKHHVMVKFIASLLILGSSHVTHAQWKKAETLTGGAIVSDMISFNGDLYVAMVSAGIFKSSDEGNTWTQVAVPVQPNFVHFASNGSNLLAICYGKTFSTANGDVWTEGAGPEAFINDVSFDGLNIFAATTNGIYHSGNGGMTWARNSDVQSHQNIKSIAVKGDNVWAGLDSPAAGTLLKSDNGGTSWTKTTRGTILIRDIVINGNDVFLNISYDGIYKSANQGVDWQLIRNLENSEGKLYAAPSGLYYFSHYKLYSSTNSGNTWREKSELIPLFNSQTLYTTDQHVFVGLWGGGVVRTSIAGDTDWQLVNNGIAVHHINDLVVVGSTIYAGLENSFVRSSTDEGLRWEQKKDTYNLFAGSGRALLSTDSELFVGSGGGGVQRSSDNGATWLLKNEGLVSQNVLDFASIGKAIFVGTDDGVYKSANNGDNWTKKTGDIAMLRTLHTDGNIIYAGTYNGLFQSKDVGETWTRISTGLPNESIGIIVHMGTVLYAATQFNGLYKTSNSGSSWEKANSEYVQAIALRNNQELLISADSGKTTEDITASLPSGIVSAISFTKEHIVIGKGNAGLWTRKLSELLPPYLTLHSDRNDNKFYVNSPLYLDSDQTLYSPAGIALSEADVLNYITVKTGEGNTVPYSAQIDADQKLITLSITGVEEGDVYTVTVQPLENESGLVSLAMSKSFTAVVNRIPVVSDVLAEGEQGHIVSFNEEMFFEAFLDEDGDPLVNFRIKELPSHGILKLNDTPVTVNQVITTAPLGQLTYTPQSTFTGTDHWYWNGSDGIDYSTADAKVTINIAPVTAVSAEVPFDFKLYPNPILSKLKVEAATTEAYRIDILDMVGRQMRFAVVRNPNFVFSSELDLSDMPAGVYMVRIQPSTGQQFQRKVIKK